MFRLSLDLLRLHPSCSLGLLGLGLVACAPAESDDDPLAPRSATSAEVSTVSLGSGTTCATTTDGEAVCWGQGGWGRLGLGDGSTDDEPDPSGLGSLDLGADATAVVTNGQQAYALLDDGGVRAFGRNDVGQLGLGHILTIGDDETPAMASVTTMVPLAGPAVELGAGSGFACARLYDGRVQCWGRSDLGQLGRGVQAGLHDPADVVLGGVAVGLSVGADHACAVLQGGAIRCWGDDAAAQLGYSGGGGGTHPAELGDVPVGGAAVAVSAGGTHTCAVLGSGTLRCWGGNEHGQLGYGHTFTIGDDESPAAAGDVDLGGPVSAVATGRRHTCARLGDGALRCWGDGSLLQHGLDVPEAVGDDELPITVAAVDFDGAPVEAIFTGALAEHTCARLDDGRLRCWGLGQHGQLGIGLVDPDDPVEGPPGDLPDVIVVEDLD